ncbi:TetR family transcriptional regulator [Microbacterium excoecariae]|uniref:TetR family transcriptional regulator n=1 Tax=Microbacterium excoecariae TaxID=2715210 RepID=UPI00140A8549|nr:TetR/AcrR family transcriptional regulator [Microbacterium excoecariae]
MTDSARRTRPHGDERRRQILASATRLFSEGGFARVSLGDVARDVGLSQAGLLHHFPHKSALLLAVLQERERGAEDPGLERPHGRAYVDQFIEVLAENERAPQLVRLFAIMSAESITEDHPAHEWFANRYERLLATATAELEAIVDPATLPAGITVTTLAQWLIGLADGLRQQALILPGSVDRVASMRAFFAFLDPYLAPDAQPLGG